MSRSQSSAVRQIVAELVIGVAACAGIYLVGVDPAERTLTKVREQITALRQQAAAAAAFTGTPEDAREQLGNARSFAATVSQRSRMARSETEMIATIAGLARRHGVRIDDLRPANPRTAVKIKSDAKPIPGDRLVAYAFSMVADFADIVSLLSDARQELGFVVVQSVKVTPIEGAGETTIRVTVQTEHRAFDTTALELAGAPAANEHDHAGAEGAP